METISNIKKATTSADATPQLQPGHQPPIQTQPYPGVEKKMSPLPVYNKLPSSDGSGNYELYKAIGKLVGKKALITGGDSGIGRAIAVLFAMEGVTDITIGYLPVEEEDAQETKAIVEGYGSRCHLCPGDLSNSEGCKQLAERAAQNGSGVIDILVNNAAYQMTVERIEDLSEEQWDRTFRTNVYSMFWLSKYCLPYMPSNSSTIINNASINHYVGKPNLLDYSSTKGAVIAFTRALSNQLLNNGKRIRVNAVAPGPIWTPLIVSTMSKKDLDKFGSTPMGRPGQPSEVATCFVFLASQDSSFISGSVLHPNGGTITGV